MPRKWMILAASMVSMSVLTVGIAGADDEDSPLHKLMERVNAKNLAVTKGVRTAVAFKKAQSDVVAAAEDLAKLAKEARELGKDTVKKAKEVPNAAAKWNELMDAFASTSENLAKVAGKAGATQEEAKSAHTAVKKACTDCHTLFRIEE
jgi:cytochrome c556